jgi:hypothetical protein
MPAHHSARQRPASAAPLRTPQGRSKGGGSFSMAAAADGKENLRDGGAAYEASASVTVTEVDVGDPGAPAPPPRPAAAARGGGGAVRESRRVLMAPAPPARAGAVTPGADRVRAHSQPSVLSDHGAQVAAEAAAVRASGGSSSSSSSRAARGQSAGVARGGGEARVPARGGGNSKRRQAAAAASVGKRRPASAPLHALNGTAARAPGAAGKVPGKAGVGAKAVKVAGGKAAAPAVDPWAPTFAYDHNVVVANKRQYMALLAGSSDLFTAHSTFRNAARVAHRPPAGGHTEGVVAALRKNYAFLDGAKRENEQALPAAFHRYNPDKRAARPLEATRFHGLRNWDNEEPFFVKGVPFPECEVRSRAPATAAAAAMLRPPLAPLPLPASIVRGSDRLPAAVLFLARSPARLRSSQPLASHSRAELEQAARCEA